MCGPTSRLLQSLDRSFQVQSRLRFMARTHRGCANRESSRERDDYIPSHHDALRANTERPAAVKVAVQQMNPRIRGRNKDVQITACSFGNLPRS
jgi:hypothetical protein